MSCPQNKKINIFYPLSLPVSGTSCISQTGTDSFRKTILLMFPLKCVLLDLPFLLILSKLCMFLKTKFKHNHLSATFLGHPQQELTHTGSTELRVLGGRRWGEWKTCSILLFMLFSSCPKILTVISQFTMLRN